MKPYEKTWTAARALLQETLAEDTFRRWIDVIRPLPASDETTLVLGVPDGYYREWLEENYLASILDALRAVGETGIAVRLAVDADRPVDPAPAPEPFPPSAGARPRAAKGRACRNCGMDLNPGNTFSSFVVGASNQFAHAAAEAVAAAPGKAYNPLFIYGGTGLGKTHLMQAIAHEIIASGKGNVCYTTSEAFTNDFIQATMTGGFAAFRKKYRAMDALLIDDVQFLAKKDKTLEEFFHTFNALYESQKQIVLTCDRPIAEIPDLPKRLVSRFEWGLKVEMETADLETRIAILRSKRDAMHLNASDETIDFIATHIKSNIRELEGALTRVTSYASLTRRPLSRETLEYLLRDNLAAEQRQALTAEQIQRTVTEHYDLRMCDMTSRDRHEAIAFPRQVAMYLCREMTDLSLPEIGRAFQKNHATVLHAVRAVEKKMKTDSTLRQGIISLQQRVARGN
ncbi:MAG: chromosomal replication initiator protein DnaA [Kiritimatiellae bacterium]|nr:chromosomal replication initiator protein DnaA [Kiritimatiellia bacterium]